MTIVIILYVLICLPGFRVPVIRYSTGYICFA